MTFWAGYVGNKTVSCTAPIDAEEMVLDEEDKEKGGALSDQ